MVACDSKNVCFLINLTQKLHKNFFQFKVPIWMVSLWMRRNNTGRERIWRN